MRVAEPHCDCLMLFDKEHAVRSRRNRRKEKWEMRALVERLRALEDTDLPSSIGTVTPAIPTSIPADRPRRLVHWFSVGFACACIAGGIALLAELIDVRANETAPPVALGFPFRPGLQ